MLERVSVNYAGQANRRLFLNRIGEPAPGHRVTTIANVQPLCSWDSGMRASKDTIGAVFDGIPTMRILSTLVAVGVSNACLGDLMRFLRG
jgi:hypothetical protein